MNWKKSKIKLDGIKKFSNIVINASKITYIQTIKDGYRIVLDSPPKVNGDFYWGAGELRTEKEYIDISSESGRKAVEEFINKTTN